MSRCYTCETPDGESMLIRADVAWVAAEDFVQELAEGGNLAQGDPVYVRTTDENQKREYFAVTWHWRADADALSSPDTARKEFDHV